MDRFLLNTNFIDSPLLCPVGGNVTPPRNIEVPIPSNHDGELT